MSNQISINDENLSRRVKDTDIKHFDFLSDDYHHSEMKNDFPISPTLSPFKKSPRDNLIKKIHLS
jgi:hypothetical protein